MMINIYQSGKKKLLGITEIFLGSARRQAHKFERMQDDLPFSKREEATRTGGSSSRRRTTRCPAGTRSLMARGSATALKQTAVTLIPY